MIRTNYTNSTTSVNGAWGVAWGVCVWGGGGVLIINRFSPLFQKGLFFGGGGVLIINRFSPLFQKGLFLWGGGGC